MEYVRAFVVGGLICVVGQLLMDGTKLTPAHVLVAFVTSGAILSAFGIYGPLVEFGGTGATIPLTGFGHNLAKGAIDSVEKVGLLGAFTGGIEANAGGVAAAVVFGYLMAVIFKPKSKK